MLRVAIAAVLVALAAACEQVEPPPFTFRASHAGVTLFEKQYPSYADAKRAGAISVSFEEDGRAVEVTKAVGFCEQAAPCAGPLELEHLRLTARSSDAIAGYECRGLDGALSFQSIDVSASGACR